MTPNQIIQYAEHAAALAAAAAAGFAAVSVPAGLLGTLLRKAGETFELKKLAWLGAKLEHFFTDGPKLLGANKRP